MSGQPADQRSPSQTYAPLRSPGAANGGDAGYGGASTAQQPASASPETNFWRQETEKLDALLRLMWDAFLDAPANGFPTDLVDYVAAYTSATRLKLKLMGYSPWSGRGVKAPAASKLKQP